VDFFSALLGISSHQHPLIHTITSIPSVFLFVQSHSESDRGTDLAKGLLSHQQTIERTQWKDCTAHVCQMYSHSS